MLFHSFGFHGERANFLKPISTPRPCAKIFLRADSAEAKAGSRLPGLITRQGKAKRGESTRGTLQRPKTKKAADSEAKAQTFVLLNVTRVPRERIHGWGSIPVVFSPGLAGSTLLWNAFDKVTSTKGAHSPSWRRKPRHRAPRRGQPKTYGYHRLKMSVMRCS